MQSPEFSIDVGEERGDFFVDEAKDEIIFTTPVLEEIGYMPPSVSSYLRRAESEGYLRAKRLFLDYEEEEGRIYLRGKWVFSKLGAEHFDGLIQLLQEVAADVKIDLYKACCKDLLYVVAHKAYTPM